MKATVIFLFLCILVLGFTTSPAFADNITIQNASFEMANSFPYSSPGFGVWNNGPIPYWTTTGVAGSWQPGPAAFSSVPNGSTVAYSNGGFIFQTLGVSLLANTTYTLSVDIGHRLDGLVSNYALSLFAGGTVLNSLAGSNGLIPIGTFADESFSFTSGASVPSGSLSIILGSAGPQTDFDNVRLVATPVPEPGSLALLAAGLGFAFFVFRRR